MYYDPIKNVFASVIKKIPVLRILFYKILDLMFLRSWYVRRELMRLRRSLGDKNIEIYDAGTGYGQYTYFMSRKMQPNNIFAVDVKEDWIRDCKDFFSTQKIMSVKFGIEDLTRIDHQERFHLITCIDVMEHIDDDIIVFKNFYKALKPGGFLLVNTPSIHGGSDVHDDNTESFIGEHAREGYSKEDLEKKLFSVGFSNYKFTYTYGFWGDKAWRLGIKYPMLMLNISKVFFLLLPLYYLITFPFTLMMMYTDYSTPNKIGTGINFIVKK